MSKKLCVIEVCFDSNNPNSDHESIKHMVWQALSHIEYGYLAEVFDSPHSGDTCRFRIIGDRDSDYRDITTSSEMHEYVMKAANMVSNHIQDAFERDEVIKPIEIGYNTSCVDERLDNMIFVKQKFHPSKDRKEVE